MKKIIETCLLSAFFVYSLSLISQNNIVPNPDFQKEDTACTKSEEFKRFNYGIEISSLLLPKVKEDEKIVSTKQTYGFGGNLTGIYNLNSKWGVVTALGLYHGKYEYEGLGVRYNPADSPLVFIDVNYLSQTKFIDYYIELMVQYGNKVNSKLFYFFNIGARMSYFQAYQEKTTAVNVNSSEVESTYEWNGNKFPRFYGAYKFHAFLSGSNLSPVLRMGTDLKVFKNATARISLHSFYAWGNTLPNLLPRDYYVSGLHTVISMGIIL
ncbi:MAG: hypothetical protein COA57_15395 [Flavobacteriales bacterium]|nr:hypothetical protein [Bacteroidales bacterium AH-315-I05]PCJ79768.1 MAG: hypothetical protein COA57_15395 [Flavobacteriales bacterium]